MAFLGAAMKEKRACTRCDGRGTMQEHAAVIGGKCFLCHGEGTVERAVKKPVSPEKAAQAKAKKEQQRLAREAASRGVAIDRAVRRAEALAAGDRLDVYSLRNLVGESYGFDEADRERIAEAAGRWGKAYRKGVDFALREGHFGFTESALAGGTFGRE
jgi:hypothetical protein